MRIFCFNTFVGSIFNDYFILSQEFLNHPVAILDGTHYHNKKTKGSIRLN